APAAGSHVRGTRARAVGAGAGGDLLRFAPPAARRCGRARRGGRVLPGPVGGPASRGHLMLGRSGPEICYPSRMRAIVVHALGDPDVLTLRVHPEPRPGPGEVLVRLEAVGVNFSDTERRRGIYDPPALPWIPGNEAAGIVEALGDGVAPGLVGRR